MFAFLQKVIANTVRASERKDRQEDTCALSCSQVMKKSDVYPLKEHSQESEQPLVSALLLINKRHVYRYFITKGNSLLGVFCYIHTMSILLQYFMLIHHLFSKCKIV